MKWDVVQLFSVFQLKEFFRNGIVFLILYNPLSADISLIVCKETLRNTANGCRKFSSRKYLIDNKINGIVFRYLCSTIRFHRPTSQRRMLHRPSHNHFRLPDYLLNGRKTILFFPWTKRSVNKKRCKKDLRWWLPHKLLLRSFKQTFSNAVNFHFRYDVDNCFKK